MIYCAPESPLCLLYLDFLGLLFIGEMPPAVLLSPFDKHSSVEGRKQIQSRPLVRSAFCPKKIDHISGLTLHPYTLFTVIRGCQ